MNAHNKTVIWVSDDPSIASVNELGKVTGISVGTTMIHLISDENPEITDEVKIEVKPISVKNIRVESGAAEEGSVGSTFVDAQEISEDGVLTLKHHLDEELFLRTVVNADAANKQVGLEIYDEDDIDIDVIDVTDEFEDSTEANRVYLIELPDIGEYSVYCKALDGNGASKSNPSRSA
ncbi:MAG: Ig-like domain-containing protein [Eubacterium sp.]|nr:Ig-like domain-containing protein [Eubacterium sp.]